MSRDDYSAGALRVGTWHFLTGKLASATLTVIALLWAVRLLPVDEYATYVTMFALVEFSLVVGNFGLPWMASRYIPEYNLKAGLSALRRLCLQLLAVQILALLLVAGPLALAVPLLGLASASTGQAGLVLALCTMLLSEGVGRFVRDSQLSPLMMQRAARTSLVARQLLLVLGIAAMALLDLRSAQVLFLVECAASLVSTGLALEALRRRLRPLPDASSERAPAADWRQHDTRAQYAVALRMYGAHLMSLPYSPLVLLHFVQRLAGTEAAALYGFLRLVHDQVARYLPAMLLFSLIRPKLMAGFVQGGFADLNRNAVLCGKLSLFVLCPVLAAVAVGGDAVVRLLSSGRFTGDGWVLLGFILALVPYSQRQLLESVAVAAGVSRLCLMASTLSAVALPLTLMLWPSPFGVATALATMVLGHGLFDLLLSASLRRSVGFRGDLAGALKLTVATLMATAAGWALTTLRAGDAWQMAAAALAAISFLAASWVIKPFTPEERDRVNGFVRRKVFVW